MTSRSLKSIIATALIFALAGCGGGSPGVQSVPAPTKNATIKVDAAFNSLMAGDEGAARKQAKAILKRDPNNASAQLLLNSLQRDPVELLGPENYEYTAKPRDTIISIAERLLGNRFKAYQLLRYNKLSAPANLSAGQVLRIPGAQLRRIDTPRRAEPTPPSAPTRSATELTKPAVRPKLAPKVPAVVTVNTVAARQARAAGLTALNQGAVFRAIPLLKRAVALDPSNPAAARDLARAERIAATVRAKR